MICLDNSEKSMLLLFIYLFTIILYSIDITKYTIIFINNNNVICLKFI